MPIHQDTRRVLYDHPVRVVEPTEAEREAHRRAHEREEAACEYVDARMVRPDDGWVWEDD